MDVKFSAQFHPRGNLSLNFSFSALTFGQQK